MTYCKIRRTWLQQRARLRAYIGYVFPEFLDIVKLDTETARYLLKQYFLPEQYLHMNIESVGKEIAKISQNQYGVQTLKRLQQAARQTIGIVKDEAEIIAGRLAIDTWLAMEAQAKEQRDQIKATLIELCRKTPEFAIIKSIKGISDLLTALFIAETRDLSLYNHHKQIEKCAGLNLRLRESGRYRGRKRISKIGNKRLSWILYWMVEQTARVIPEIRIKYLKRQIKKQCHRQSLIACVPVLVKLIIQLVKEQRLYEMRPEKIAEMTKLERLYQPQKNKTKKKVPRKTKAA